MIDVRCLDTCKHSSVEEKVKLVSVSAEIVLVYVATVVVVAGTAAQA
jgi:hypothetical protein